MNKKAAWHWLIVLILIAAAVIFAGKGATKLAILGDDVTFKFTQREGSDQPKIGDKEFSATPPQYVCPYDGRLEVKAKGAVPSCWKTVITYDGKILNLYSGQEIQLTDIMKVRFEPTAKAKFNEGNLLGVEDWESVYTFTVDLENALYTTPVSLPAEIELGSDQEAMIEITNNIADFEEGYSGLWIRVRHSLLERGEALQTINHQIDEGRNKYLIAVDTSELGNVEMEVQPFVIFKADKIVTLYQPEPLTFKYKVVLRAEPEPVVEQKVTGWQKFIAWIKGWFD